MFFYSFNGDFFTNGSWPNSPSPITPLHIYSPDKRSSPAVLDQTHVVSHSPEGMLKKDLNDARQKE